MLRSLLAKTRPHRDDGPLDPPRVMATGMTASPSAVWAWATIPVKATDMVNTATQRQLTADGTSALRRLLPTDTEFHIKVMWRRWDGKLYESEELARIGEHATDTQRAYIALGGSRIDANQMPQRLILLGIRLNAEGGKLPEALRSTTRAVAGDGAQVTDSALALTTAAKAAQAWLARMSASVFSARPATVKELAWALRRDLRRTVGWLPDGPLAGRGELARLVSGCYVVPKADHLEVQTDTGISYLRLVTCAQTGFPSTDMELPGGEWLKDLILGGEFDTGPVPPIEVSIRGRNIAQRDAVRRLRDSLALTKEQDREAGHGVAQEAPEDVLEARQVLATRLKEVRQGTVGMVEDYPVWIVEGDSLEALDRRTATLIDFYGGRGITLWTPEHVQDLLYKESVLGDRLRFTDCGQFRPMSTLVGSWFHGGSTLGHNIGPYLAAIIGSTPGPFRYRITDAQLENDAVTTLFLGRTRAGKSTALMLTLLAELVYGAVGALTDQKGDLAGIVAACELLGIPCTAVSSDQQASGSMDPFRYVTDPDEAASMAGDFLLQLLRPAARDTAESIIKAATNVVAAREDGHKRSSNEVIQLLLASTREEEVRVGRDLAELAKDPNARPVVGPWAPDTPSLKLNRGLLYFRYAGQRLPEPDSDQTTWAPGERVSIMALQAGYAFLTYLTGRVRDVAKVVGLTELHLITAYPFGRALVGRLARTGAALDTNVLLDTQAAAELLQIAGLIDQVSTVFAFRVDSAAEATAQAELLGLQAEPAVIARQQGWRAGQCQVRDRWRQVAPIQFDLMTTALAAALSTTPDRGRAAAATAAEIAETQAAIDAVLEEDAA